MPVFCRLFWPDAPGAQGNKPAQGHTGACKSKTLPASSGRPGAPANHPKWPREPRTRTHDNFAREHKHKHSQRTHDATIAANTHSREPRTLANTNGREARTRANAIFANTCREHHGAAANTPHTLPANTNAREHERVNTDTREPQTQTARTPFWPNYNTSKLMSSPKYGSFPFVLSHCAVS